LSSKPFNKVLIANRGEIACRIARTCHRLGIATVAVYSDADRDAQHVQSCDEAHRLGPAAASESYLHIERLLAVAKATGAEAIHPGYGFLAQSSAFARACRDAGIVFIGPSPESTDKMGRKDAAKALMAAAGVPVVPGYHGADQTEATLAKEAARVGFPLMIKAVAGGGGKGMRRVDAQAGFAEALAGARREGKASFGDDRVLLERYVQGPRHIEVQVFGDAHGGVIHLNERECSIQRRFQKVVEETPSPFVDAALRRAMGEAAVRAAQAVGYVNAGTVEFIVGGDRAFYFMEMNTRLQVEHPVTEQVTGLDLVEWQLRIAAGERLPLAQAEVESRGHAIEVRLCAEDPRRGFVPASGRLTAFHTPADEDAAVRLDAGFAAGDRVPPDYDSMIAKLIVGGADRAAAVAKLREALADTVVLGIANNLPLLRAIAHDPGFAAGAFDTHFLDGRLDALLGGAAPEAAWQAALAAVLADLVPGHQGADALDPWECHDGWRIGGLGQVAIELDDGTGHTRRFLCAARRDRSWRVTHDGGAFTLALATPTLLLLEGASDIDLTVDGARIAARFMLVGADCHVALGDRAWTFRLHDPLAGKGHGADDAHPGSPMPGTVVALHVKVGDRVAAGQPILVLEGMKMEFTLRAPLAGTVTELHAAVGSRVDAEVPLVDIEPAPDDGAAP
jgi:3-methylcrotonyl-CoA carboxylase alpha subunit